MAAIAGRFYSGDQIVGAMQAAFGSVFRSVLVDHMVGKMTEFLESQEAAEPGTMQSMQALEAAPSAQTTKKRKASTAKGKATKRPKRESVTQPYHVYTIWAMDRIREARLVDDCTGLLQKAALSWKMLSPEKQASITSQLQIAATWINGRRATMPDSNVPVGTLLKQYYEATGTKLDFNIDDNLKAAVLKGEENLANKAAQAAKDGTLKAPSSAKPKAKTAATAGAAKAPPPPATAANLVSPFAAVAVVPPTASKPAAVTPSAVASTAAVVAVKKVAAKPAAVAPAPAPAATPISPELVPLRRKKKKKSKDHDEHEKHKSRDDKKKHNTSQADKMVTAA